jgi:hypothetical protein
MNAGGLSLPNHPAKSLAMIEDLRPRVLTEASAKKLAHPGGTNGDLLLKLDDVLNTRQVSNAEVVKSYMGKLGYPANQQNVLLADDIYKIVSVSNAHPHA